MYDIVKISTYERLDIVLDTTRFVTAIQQGDDVITLVFADGNCVEMPGRVVYVHSQPGADGHFSIELRCGRSRESLRFRTSKEQLRILDGAFAAHAW